MNHAILSIMLASLGQIIIKGSLNNLGRTQDDLNLNFITSVFLNWKVLLGLGFYGLAAILWVYALSKYELSQLYLLTGLSFILVIFLAHFVLGEPVSLPQAAGTLLIFCGVTLVNI